MIDTRRSYVGIFALLFAAHGASASDGRIEINQASALAGGVTATDTPGFPVTIGRGSYVLTSDLNVTDASKHGIEVEFGTEGVRIDLNGFAISGPQVCSAPACATSGSVVSGIFAFNVNQIRVRNGTARGFAGYGIRVSGNSARISEVEAIYNGNAGIAIGDGAVTDSTSMGNGGYGIEAPTVRQCGTSFNRVGGIASGLAISDSIANGNLGFGISAGLNSVVINNTVFSNGSVGISAGASVTVRGNVANSNAIDGIRVLGSGSLVVDNIANSNGAAGIAVLASGSVQRNTANNNGLGLYLVPESGGNAAAYRENVMNGNSVANVSGGVNLLNNSCNGTATCP